MADEEPRKDDADEPLSTDDDSDEPELYSILLLARAARIAREKELDAEIPIGESGQVIINPEEKGSEGLII